MGPYMSPIPINASMGMLLSLAIAFTLTPWLARMWLKHSTTESTEQVPQKSGRLPVFLTGLFEGLF